MAQYEGGLFRKWASNPGTGPLFPLTDESLEAIMVGLEPNFGDSVLSVAGCGDQAFAILEKAGKVVVCDINEAQLELLRKRKAGLEIGDYDAFFNPTGTDYEFFGATYRMEYFSEGDRLERVVNNLPNLEIISSKGIEDFAGERTFTKIYASNAIGEAYSKGELRIYLACVSVVLQESGLLYVSNGAEINDLAPDISNLKLRLVLELTERARSLERIWTPNVYKKVSLEK